MSAAVRAGATRVSMAPWTAAIIMLLALATVVEHAHAARMLQTPTANLDDIIHRTRSLLVHPHACMHAQTCNPEYGSSEASWQAALPAVSSTQPLNSAGQPIRTLAPDFSNDSSRNQLCCVCSVASLFSCWSWAVWHPWHQLPTCRLWPHLLRLLHLS
jgi:hypothetical protein